MVKENLLKFDGRRLFPERIANTVAYRLSDAEARLYREVTDYVREEFNRAEALENGKRAGTVGFALTILQRRLASSPEAIYQSLRRRRERLEGRLRELEVLQRGGAVASALATSVRALDAEDIEDLEEAPDNEVEAAEEEILDQATAARTIAELKAEIETVGLGVLNWGEQAKALRARLAFLRGLDEAWPDISDEGLLASREDWLWPLLDGARSLADISDGRLAEALRGLIPWDLQRKLDDLAPTRLTTPLGSAGIDYAAEGGPRVEIRVQELFGVKAHPTVGGGRAPLTLSLLSPARRPVQVTKDLPGFWAGSWSAVRSEMRGRYPRHPWPEDPANATATSRAKPRGT
jgi:HrpA-like RNA helicase